MSVRRLVSNPGFWLATIAFLVYNANLRPISSADTFPARYLPISLIGEGDLDLDEFPFLFDSEWLDSTGVPYFLALVDGHYYSAYPITSSIVAVPVYAIPVLLGLADGGIDDHASHGYSRIEVVGTALSKVTASLATAVSVWLVFAGCTALGGDRRTALWIAAAYAFATSSWSVSSQGLWQNTMSQMWLSVAWYSLAVLPRRSGAITWTGAAVAMAVASRPTAIVFAVAILVYVVAHERRLLLRFLPGPVIIGGLLLTYNVYLFGNAFGGYSTNPGEFAYPSLVAFAGLLFSPSRGMVVLSPILLVGVAGLIAAWKRPGELWWRYVSVASFGTLLLLSAWESWHAAFTYSYRFLVDLLPGLALASTFVLTPLLRRPAVRRATVAALVFSLAVQVVGVFNYPCGWYESPTSLMDDPGRAWSWTDPEPLRCLRSGPVVPEVLQTSP